MYTERIGPFTFGQLYITLLGKNLHGHTGQNIHVPPNSAGCQPLSEEGKIRVTDKV